MKNQWVPLLVVLGLSAAFDTTDHFILLNRLRYDLGINGYCSILIRGVSQGSPWPAVVYYLCRRHVPCYR